jgi:hypothetical protein
VIQLRDESVYDLLHPAGVPQGREDTALVFEMKLLFLLGKSSEYVAASIFRSWGRSLIQSFAVFCKMRPVWFRELWRKGHIN